MSKSLGNGIDPLEVVEKYGADALRMTLITGNAPGNDMRFYWERVEANRNFANKVWNASRFIMMNMPVDEQGNWIEADSSVMPKHLETEDKWILSLYNDTVREVTDNMEKYELGIAVSKVYDFIWGSFCDWYIEMVKPRLYETEDAASKEAALWTLQTVLKGALKLLHPYMPFITEEIFTTIQSKEETIMTSAWPVYQDACHFPEQEKAVERIMEAVRGIRTARTEHNVAPSRKAKVIVTSEKEEVRRIFEDGKLLFAKLANASEVQTAADAKDVPEGSISVVLPDAVLYLPLADLVDVAAELARLEKEEARLAGELARSQKMLSNERFLAKAPKAKIDEEKEKQKNYEAQMEGVRRELAQMRALEK